MEQTLVEKPVVDLHVGKGLGATSLFWVKEKITEGRKPASKRTPTPIPGSNLDTEMSVEVFVALYSRTL